MATYSVRSAAVCSRSCVESTYHTAPDAATPVAVPKKKPDMLLAPKQSTKFDRCRIGMDDLGLNFGMTLLDGKNPELPVPRPSVHAVQTVSLFWAMLDA